ncbi:MAG: ribose-5-phosphate isomerase RpiA [Gammaproteobacteria bacterium]|nr:ribose-5-phosphate isomerase RpiA [Gammaproteobacteria bacterium]
MSQNEEKREAASAALEFIKPGCALGVGTGSTVNYLIDALPAVKDKIQSIVSSSVDSTKRLRSIGFEVSELAEVGHCDLYIDGADEANKHFQLIKGGGGALTREKVIAAASRKFVCIIDQTKMVGVLGAFPLPIEVIPMARSYVAREIIKYRGQPVFREGFMTDNGNQIIDVHNLSITNPIEIESRISLIPGVVTVGLFCHRPADVLLIGAPDGVKCHER